MDAVSSDDSVKFTKDRVLAVIKEYGLNKHQTARIMGYQRTAFSRWLVEGRRVNTERLYKLSTHLNLPMSYWFPVSEGTPLPVSESVLVQNLTEGVTKLTKDIVETIVRLPATEKYQLLAFLTEVPELFPDALKLVGELRGMDDVSRSRIIAAVATLARQKRSEPAP